MRTNLEYTLNFSKFLKVIIRVSIIFSLFLGAFINAQEVFLELKTSGLKELPVTVLWISGYPEWNDTVREDLLNSGQIKIIEPPQNLPEDPLKAFEILKNIGAEFFLTTNLSKEGENLILRHNLYDVKAKKIIFAKKYKGEKKTIKTMAHTLTDELLYHLTGQKGISLTKIAFISDRTGFKELYIMDADGSNQQPLTLYKSICLSPAWAPSGKEIYFVSYHTGKPSIVSLQWLEGKAVNLKLPFKSASSPCVSPDGKYLLFSGSRGNSTNIYRLDLETNQYEQLTFSKSIDTDGFYSPFGNFILFTSGRGGSPQIYYMNNEGLDVKKITFEGSYNAEPKISPEGNYFVYTSREGLNFQIYLQEISTGLRVPLTFSGSNESPCFSPDGKKIVYSSNITGNYEIYVMDLNGENKKRLTFTGNNTQPVWSPYLK